MNQTLVNEEGHHDILRLPLRLGSSSTWFMILHKCVYLNENKIVKVAVG